MVKAILAFLAESLFPEYCLSCGQDGSLWCERCWGQIRLIECLICPVCSRQSSTGRTHPVCQSESGLDGLISLVLYKGSLSRLILRYKYPPFVRGLCIYWLKLLKEAETAQTLIWPFLDLVIAIPLHWSKHNWRGFNQAVDLAQLVAQHRRLPCKPSVLRRVKATVSQVQLGRIKRQSNIEESFVTNPANRKIVKGQRLLLVDDVWTTGATIKEAGRVLKESGADQVWGFTLARED